jgi:iron complex transport system permease protein
MTTVLPGGTRPNKALRFIAECAVISHPASSPRFAVLALIAACVALASLVVGSTEIGLRPAVAALRGDLAEPARTVVLELRMPRLLSAFAIGALLALAGVLLQALFRNPLADSYVLGVSGGSSVGALLALLAGGSLWFVQ